MNCSVIPILTRSARLCACIISLPSNYRTLAFNVYMPCDTHDGDNVRVFDEVLDEIESLIESHSDVDVVIVSSQCKYV